MSASLDHESGTDRTLAAVSSSACGRPSPEQLDRRRVASARMFCASAVALVLSLFLPWATVLAVVSVHPSGGQVVYLLAFAAIYAGACHKVYRRRVTRTFMIAAWVVNAWMVVNVLAIFNALGKGDGLVSPGAGLYIASLGALSGIAATIELHRSRVRSEAPAAVDGTGNPR
jgi:hypothetical protein